MATGVGINQLSKKKQRDLKRAQEHAKRMQLHNDDPSVGHAAINKCKNADMEIKKRMNDNGDHPLQKVRKKTSVDSSQIDEIVKTSKQRRATSSTEVVQYSACTAGWRKAPPRSEADGSMSVTDNARNWLDSSTIADAARGLLIGLSLRSGPDALVFLKIKLMNWGALADPSALAILLGPALLHCSDRGLLPCVTLLLSRGAPADGAGSRAIFRAVPSRTPLELAAARGHVAICRELLEYGATQGRARDVA
eukprot:CAMPEP_0117530166 /NCGR_PEP_ID=MMETSP0784-20121206/38204_1 /TAXON_ID=39447 /ORGANISM="" /LENGTH=250 /DNA_ID=CAMNT_0005326503 /DNA_START=89 /DNA_END=838 /DNA_ORIENTATION=+